MPQREQRVTPLELFFDLVFVYAITQVTLLMSDDPTWHGLGSGLLTALVLATGVSCALIAYDVIHYREDRAQVRAARP